MLPVLSLSKCFCFLDFEASFHLPSNVCHSPHLIDLLVEIHHLLHLCLGTLRYGTTPGQGPDSKMNPVSLVESARLQFLVNIY